MVQSTMGLPTMGYVPTQALDSIYPYLTYLPNLAQAQALAALGEQGALQRANISANAQRAGDIARAGATVDAARLAAQGGITQANIGALAQLRGLQPTLQLQAATANQDTLMNLARMMGSGQLRDAIAGRLALYGQGAVPGIASALKGMPSPWITAPTVNMSGFSGGGNLGGGGNYGGGSYSGSYQASAPNIASLFNSAYGNLRNTMTPTNPFNYSSGTPGSPTPAPAPMPVDAMRMLQSGNQAGADAILRQVAGLADGTPDAGKAYLVGDGAGVIPGVTEVMRVNKEGVEVIPIEGGAAAGLWGPSPGAGSSGYDTWKASQIPDSPAYNAAKASTASSQRMSRPAGQPYNFGVGGRGSYGNRNATSWADVGQEGFMSSLRNLATRGGSRPPAGSGLPQSPIGITPSSGILSDVNNIPALQMLRSGNVLAPFGTGPQSYAEPGLGFSSTPAPYLAASTFNRMSPMEQEDALQAWEFLGVPRLAALNQMAQATPGYRSFQPMSFTF